MRQLWIASMGLVLGVVSTLAPLPAEAQIRLPPGSGINPASRPPVSPYINLLRRDVNPAISYFGIVRPELAAQNSIQQLNQQQNYLNNQMQQEQAAAGAGLPPTGHASGFFTQSRYFMTKGA